MKKNRKNNFDSNVKDNNIHGKKWKSRKMQKIIWYVWAIWYVLVMCYEPYEIIKHCATATNRDVFTLIWHGIVIGCIIVLTCTELKEIDEEPKE